MADKNAFRGLNDDAKVAVLLELLLQTATPAAGTPFSASVNTTLDGLTESTVQSLLASYCARMKRASAGF